MNSPHNTSTHTSDSEEQGFHGLPMSMMVPSDDEDDSYMIHNPEGSDLEDDDDDGTGIHIPDEMMMVMPPKSSKKSSKPSTNDVDDCNSDSFSSTNEELDKQTLSPEQQPQNRKEGSRKRKLTAPVRLPSVPDDSNDEFCCYDDGTEVNSQGVRVSRDQRSSPQQEANGSPPMLMSSGRSLSRTPELMPAAAGDEVEGEEEGGGAKGEGVKEDEMGKTGEYNLRKKSSASMAEFDVEEMEEEEFDRSSSGRSSPGKE